MQVVVYQHYVDTLDSCYAEQCTYVLPAVSDNIEDKEMNIFFFVANVNIPILHIK